MISIPQLRFWYHRFVTRPCLSPPPNSPSLTHPKHPNGPYAQSLTEGRDTEKLARHPRIIEKDGQIFQKNHRRRRRKAARSYDIEIFVFRRYGIESFPFKQRIALSDP